MSYIRQQMAARSSTNRAGEAVFVLLLVVPLTIALTAPPLLQGDTAAIECAQLVVQRWGGKARDAKAVWINLPIPHWSCTESGVEVARFGWWATESSDSQAEITPPPS